MPYGAIFQGRLGNVCFSDNTPSIVFMGKATPTSTYGTRLSHIGSLYLEHRNSSFSWWSGTEHTFRKSGYADNVIYRKYRHGIYNYGWQETDYTSSATRSDHARTCEYTVESYEKPLIFIHYSDPENNGGLVLKVENSGTTGSRGYAVWTLTVLLFYSTVADHVTARNSLELYCFSEIDSSYSNATTTYGMKIHNIAGQTMYHSDFQPCQVKEVVTIDTDSDPYGSPGFVSSLIDSTGDDYNAISKPCWFSQDYGRIKQWTTFNNHTHLSTMKFEVTLFPYAVRHISGENFEAMFGGNLETDAVYTYPYGGSGIPETNFVGADTVSWAILDGADYD